MIRSGILVLALPFLLVSVGGARNEPAGSDVAVRRDTMPPLMSLYLPIPLGVPHVEAQVTGVFVPANYRVSTTIDLVVFLRGYDINRPKSATPVDEYWNSPRHPILKSFMLREEVNKSGKNVILAVPTLGPFAEVGKLKDAGGPQEFLGRILDGLWRSGPHVGFANRPTIRHLILAAHSGGGVPLRRLAQVLGDDDAFKDKLKECWGFDSIYGVKDKDAEFWADWAKRHLRQGHHVLPFHAKGHRQGPQAAGESQQSPRPPGADGHHIPGHGTRASGQRPKARQCRGGAQNQGIDLEPH